MAAGYATRLYPLTIAQPKSLLPIGGLSIIDYIVRKIEKLKSIEEIIVITNQKFYQHFEKWSKEVRGKTKRAALRIISDGTTSEENKLGAIRDIDFVISNYLGKNEDILVVAGDNLFEQSLSEFLKFSLTKSPASTIGLHRINDISLAKHYGCVEVDRYSKITCFEEKSSNPLSVLAAMCLYCLSSKHLEMINEYIKGGNNLDAPGHFISWLADKDSVYGFEFKGKWYDIGDRVSYESAVRNFKGGLA